MYILFSFFTTTTAEGLLRSTGIVIAVIVFPMGLGLLVASCVCLKEPTPEEEEPQAKKQPSKGIIINIFIIISFNKKYIYCLYNYTHVFTKEQKSIDHNTRVYKGYTYLQPETIDSLDIYNSQIPWIFLVFLGNLILINRKK